jgi:hypothetical protein
VRTDDLIVQLARSARPITPLPPPNVRAVRWLAAAAVVIVVAMVVIGPRDDLSSALRQPIFAGSIAALLLTLVSGAAAAFALSVPGAERSSAQRILPLVTAAAWSAIWFVAWSTAAVPEGPGTAAVHRACVMQIAVCAMAMGGLLFMMVARAAPLRPLATAAVASLASMATGAIVAQVLCPLDDPLHQLIGHVVIAIVVAVGGRVAGRRALQAWRAR